MADPFVTLGVSRDADDDEIRRRYLDLTRQFTPEHHPDRFAAIRSAYEKIKNLESRVDYCVLSFHRDETIDSIIEEAACRIARRRVGLQALLTAAFPHR